MINPKGMMADVAGAGVINQQASGEQYQTPDYANAGGTGDRTSIITVDVDEHLTTFWRTIGSVPGNRQKLVDGIKNVTVDYVNNALSVVDRWMEFNFTTKKLITEAKFYVNAGMAACGTWKWQGYNGVSWEDIGGTFVLGSTGVSGLVQTFTQLSGNAIGYTKYRILGVSGTSSYNLYYWNEFEFKIGALL